MKKILCQTANCEHNLKNTCLAGVITVGEKGKCLTKIKREGGVLAQAFADVEAAEEISPDRGYDCIVQCNSKCIYNNGNICSCDEIRVDDSVLSAKCRTRIQSRG